MTKNLLEVQILSVTFKFFLINLYRNKIKQNSDDSEGEKTEKRSTMVTENPTSAYAHGRDHDIGEVYATLDNNVWGC